MRVNLGSSLSEGPTFQFEEVGIFSKNDQNNQETDMKHFLKEIQTLNLPPIKNQPQIDKIKKRIEAFAKQYGEKTQKTTSIFMNYLQKVRQIGVGYLKNNDLPKAASYFAQCLRFVDPKYDQIFYQKFLIVKIDAINKLMYCLFELQSNKNKQKNISDWEKNSTRYKNGESILVQFIGQLKEFPKYQSLKKSQNCLLQVTHFYLGRLRRKNNHNQIALQAFEAALKLMELKLSLKQSLKNNQIRQFLMNLRVKIYYKMSKCYRQLKNNEEQLKYQTIALDEANAVSNPKLQYYIRKKITFYKAKEKFIDRLSKLEGKRKIEEQITRLIQQSKQNEIKSLYDIYQFQQGVSFK